MAKKIISANAKPGIPNIMLKDYLDHIMVAKGYSEKTKVSYKTAFKLFIIFMWEQHHTTVENITFDMLDTKTIEEYLDWLESNRGNSCSTRNTRLAALKSFAKYAVNHDFEAASKFHLNMSRVDRKKGVELERAFFSTKEVKILIDLPKLNTISGRRDATLLPFMFATACRAQELCDLKTKDIEFMENSRARITLHGKGSKNRKITVSPEVAQILSRYMRYRRIIDVPDAYVFVTQNSPQMSVSCLESIYKKYVRLAREYYPNLFQEKSYPPHSMRHSTAISMLAAGVPLSVIKVFLGHEHISTTEIYARITQPSMEESLIEWNKSFWTGMEDYETDNSHHTNEPEKNTKDDDDGIIPDYLR